jgi:D-serine deaminase-like pyridoxal phosphate-dependent protein
MRERAERMAHALEREGERLDALISGGVSAGRSPLSADDAASLLAFSGKAAAPYIAEAARGRVEADSVQLARAGLERGKAALLEFCNA